MLSSDSRVLKSSSKALSQGISLWAGGAFPPHVTLLPAGQTLIYKELLQINKKNSQKSYIQLGKEQEQLLTEKEIEMTF